MVTEGAQHCTQVWQNFGAGGQNKYPDSLRYNYKSIKTACLLLLLLLLLLQLRMIRLRAGAVAVPMCSPNKRRTPRPLA